ncbi:MAG: Ig domain-containing protein [Acidimicrobiales bacterium]
MASGSLPASLQLNTTTGTISGTPTASGSSNFTVRATGANSLSATQALTLTIMPSGLVFSGVAPTRVCDTRPASVSGITDACTGHRLAGGVPLVVNLPPFTVPSGAGAVVANVTVTGPASPGYLSVYPTGANAPASSNLNFTTGQTVANLVTVATGSAAGAASITVVMGTVTPGADVVIDVEGFDAAPVSTAGGFHPLTPARDADTRCALNPSAPACASEGIPAINQAASTLGANGQDRIQVTGVNGVPSTGVAAVAVNLTAVFPTASGYLTVAPGGTIPPGGPSSSSLNFTAGEVLANKVIVPVASDGTISVYNYAGLTDAVVDIDGWYSSAGGPPGATFTPVAPVRLADTRCGSSPVPSFCAGENLPGVNASDRPPSGGQSIAVGVGGTGTVPNTVDAAVLDVVDVIPDASNFLTVYPAGAGIPATSDVNWSPNDAYNVVPGASYAATSTGGAVDIQNGPTQPATTDIVVDLFGYYTPPSG